VALAPSLKRLDPLVAGCVLGLSLAGLVLIYSAVRTSPGLGHLVLKQAGLVLFGVLALGFFYTIDLKGLMALSWPLYGLSLLMLLLVMGVGMASRGSTRWFDLGPIHFQPSEMGKLTVMLVLARWLSQQGPQLSRWWGLIPPLLIAGLPMALIMRQPDLGSAIVLAPVALAMLFAAGAKAWHLLTLLLSAAASTPLIWFALRDYQQRRLLTFLDPEADTLGAGYNLIQSKIAIGSGGAFGRGFLQGSQSQLRFVPMHHNDFIFSVLGEEWGLVGCLVVLSLYLLLILRALKIAGSARDRQGALLCTGIATLLATQVLINIGMTTGMLPVTGITLPLLSYGGSSVMLIMVCAGILLNVRRDSRAQ
jgi:rod shape determining protein RodA